MNTNKSKHTPGPWTAHEYDKKSLGYKNGKAAYITSDSGTPAFQVLKSVKFDHRAGKTGHFWDPSAKAKDRANAALIAAAPEMAEKIERLEAEKAELLAALEAAAVALSYVPEAAPVLKDVRAAIAKAKGE